MPYEPDSHAIWARLVLASATIWPHHLCPNGEWVLRVRDVDGQCHYFIQSQRLRTADKSPQHAEILRLSMNGPLRCNCGNRPFYIGSGVCSSIVVDHLVVALFPYPLMLSVKFQKQSNYRNMLYLQTFRSLKSKIHAKSSKLKQKMILGPWTHDNHAGKSGKFFLLLSSDYPGFPPWLSPLQHISIGNYL